jgi:predicted Zn-dependent peptidase
MDVVYMQSLLQHKVIVRKLKNGVTLLLEPLPAFSTVSLAFFNRFGSRDENENEAGYSHFIEHMLFKGNEKYTKDFLSSKFDEMGGYINAYTSKEEVCIYNTIPNYYMEDSIHLIEQMFNRSLLADNELASEKGVILNELNSTLEDPQEKLWEDFFANLFLDCGLGHPIIGYEQIIQDITREKLMTFYHKNFTANKLIISIAGNFKPDEVTNLIEDLSFRTSYECIENKKPLRLSSEKFGFTRMQAEHIHVLTGSVIQQNSFEFSLLTSLLSVLLGDSFSSRLFKKVRDELGLCYTITTSTDGFRDEYLFSIYFSVEQSKYDKAIEAVNGVICDLLEHGLKDGELEKIKKQRIGEILLSNDNLSRKMNSNISYHLLTDSKMNKQKSIEFIENVSEEDIMKLAREFLNSEKMYTHVLYKKKVDQPKWTF